MSAPEHEIPKFQIKFTKVCLINIHTGQIKHVDCNNLHDFVVKHDLSCQLGDDNKNWKIFYAVPITDHDNNELIVGGYSYTRSDQENNLIASLPSMKETQQAEQRAKDYFDRHYIVERKEDKEHGK